ncbi:MAG: hypothetical protein ACOCVM_07205 [Desulfovibrionaceae bacterium]
MASNTTKTPAKTKSQPARADLARARNLAKIGMTVSLGALVWTGLNRNRYTRPWHLAAGASMVGFSLWHYSLYNQPKGGSGS